MNLNTMIGHIKPSLNKSNPCLKGLYVAIILTLYACWVIFVETSFRMQ